MRLGQKAYRNLEFTITPAVNLEAHLSPLTGEYKEENKAELHVGVIIFQHHHTLFIFESDTYAFGPRGGLPPYFAILHTWTSLYESIPIKGNGLKYIPVILIHSISFS